VVTINVIYKSIKKLGFLGFFDWLKFNHQKWNNEDSAEKALS